ncbi:MAG: hypothetical protein IKZ10_07530 [Akkermansia sp.]|nr:hypothetical protein [Akkermansia sp.]
MMTLPPFHKILATTALCLAAVGLSSCRLALHTLPDYVGKQEFELYDADKPGYEVYRCEDVLYVKLPGYYVRPRVALFESYDLKDGDWGNAFGYSPRPHIKESILYFPLTREQVSKWNERNDKKPLSFVRYQSGVLTEEQMKEKQGKLIAHGSIYGKLKTVICEAATRKNYAHYALKPIAIPLELVDTISTIPLSAAAGATGLIVGVSVTIIGSVTQPHQQQTVPLPEPENMPSEME